MTKTLKVTVDAQVTGPLANGDADRALQDWAANVAKALGDEGVRALQAFPMDKTGRAHGGFQTNLHNITAGPTATIRGPMITGVTWAPWLEGTSKRNTSASFKGYGLFRKTRTDLQKRAPVVGQEELDKIMPRLGGA